MTEPMHASGPTPMVRRLTRSREDRMLGAGVAILITARRSTAYRQQEQEVTIRCPELIRCTVR
jgi:hypothetical protein